MQEGFSEGLSREEVVAFFYRIFALPENRRQILSQWHAKKSKMESVRLSHEFKAFIYTILYDHVCFHIYHDHFTIFGSSLLIPYTWLRSEQDQRFIISLFIHRKSMFINQKDFKNNQIDYSTLKVIKDSEILSVAVKRQLIRDFVWMCREKEGAYITLELISAIQSLLLTPEGKGDVFLGALHQALQGRCDVNEVVCWDNSPFDKI